MIGVYSRIKDFIISSTANYCNQIMSQMHKNVLKTHLLFRFMPRSRRETGKAWKGGKSLIAENNIKWRELFGKSFRWVFVCIAISILFPEMRCAPPPPLSTPNLRANFLIKRSWFRAQGNDTREKTFLNNAVVVIAKSRNTSKKSISKHKWICIECAYGN